MVAPNKISFKSMETAIGKCYKVFENDEYIGYAYFEDKQRVTFNPKPEESLKAITFDNWNEMLEYISYRHY